MEEKLNSNQIDLLIQICRFTEKEAQKVFDRAKAGDLFEKEKPSLDPRRNLIGLWVEPPSCKICGCKKFTRLDPSEEGMVKDYECQNCRTRVSVKKRFFCKICKGEVMEDGEICHP